MESLFEVLAFVVESVLVGFAFAVGAALWEKLLQLLMLQTDDGEAAEPPAAAPAPTPAPSAPPEPPPSPSPEPPPPQRRRPKPK